MADPLSYGNADRDIEHTLLALKKGTQLVKYSRKGKPKVCPFRVSTDETTLIWYSHGEERNLKLSSVSRIIPGQRTPVFKRYLRPEKDYLSFSLIYNNGERSLDLICKDQAEAEVWLTGLKSLISTGQQRGRRSRSDISDIQGVIDPVQSGSSFGAAIDISSSVPRGSVDLSFRDSPWNFASSDVASERPSMQLRTSGASDGFRISVSSTPSCASGGSGPDDIESLGDVYIWGEVWSDVVSPDGLMSPEPTKSDVLLPKPLESNVVLDVHQIACGVQHFALVTRQGEVFTWGEESGGRLGHGIEKNFYHPQLVESLAVTNVDFVACGEYHTCAVSTYGDLYTWGDGTHNAGLLGHGIDVSHWIPKRISGPLEGLQVFSVSCGTWHSALATSNGKLFTFGDGSFGALGHGDRESVSYPREVQCLSGLKTIKVACGVWHTAAIVEVMGQSGGSMSSRKLFTWGDGDKHRLGHGSKDTYLVPSVVSSLIDYSFHQIACGSTMTVALTTSGHVFTMGSSNYGQLGNPGADGKLPCLVQDRLVGEFVEEISCGSHHVAVLTTRSEVYTWGLGANGRLGHGDTENRSSPTLIEALKDRHVKSISCGSSFTSCISIHKWVSGTDQSVCSGCRQPFGFTRKRHNCYNCGLVHCGACSSKKALKAALAPTPGKPHRVCDSCYAKLKAAEAGYASNISKKSTPPRRSVDGKDVIIRGDVRSSRILLSPATEPVKYQEIKLGKHGSRSDSTFVRASQVPSHQSIKDITFPSSLSALQIAFRPSLTTPQPHSTVNSRPPSPYSRRPSPPRAASPVFSRTPIDGLKKTNDVLSQEITKLQNQVKKLKQKCDAKDVEIQKLRKAAEKAALLVEDGSSRHMLATNVVKAVNEQLTEVAEKLPPEVCESEDFKTIRAQIESFLDTNASSDTISSLPASFASVQQDAPNNFSSGVEFPNSRDHKTEKHAYAAKSSDLSHDGQDSTQGSAATSVYHRRGASPNGSISDSRPHEGSASRSNGQKESTEQFEPGVYVTFTLRNGFKIFKRVRFSKRRFDNKQAEQWWKGNQDRVFKKYLPPTSSFPPKSPSPLPSEETGCSSITASPDEASSSAAAPNEKAGSFYATASAEEAGSSAATASVDENGSSSNSVPEEENGSSFNSVPEEENGSSSNPVPEEETESPSAAASAEDVNNEESSSQA